MEHDASYTTPDYSGIAPCCQDPANRRTATIDPARLAAARGGTPGVQVCAVCQRKHYTFAPDPVGTERPRG
ncbi:MAG: hypothetical protein EHM24_24075 [Acidobacteria bacterium]|nr:MAG: hypothetical protein EHM24_24075 [Acidobacteriota bacterium]